MKRNIFCLLCITITIIFANRVAAQQLMEIEYFDPVTVQLPYLADSVNVKDAAFKEIDLLKMVPVSKSILKNVKTLLTSYDSLFILKGDTEAYQIHFLQFSIYSEQFQKGKLDIRTNGIFELYMDGVKKKDKLKADSTLKTTSVDLTLEPGSVTFVLKVLILPDSAQTDQRFKISFKSNLEDVAVQMGTKEEKRFTIMNLQDGKNITGVSISPNGKYCKVSYSERKNAETIRYAELIDNESKKVLLQENGYLSKASWMPKSSLLYYTRDGLNGKELITLDPATLQTKVIHSNLPDGHYTMAPDEKTLIFSIKEEGPKESKSMNRILDNRDRYGSFRDRYFLAKYDLETSEYQLLTYGYRGTYLQDISPDSRYILFGISEYDYTKRPFSTSSLYQMDLQTLKVDTLYENEPYASGAAYSPDGKQLLISGGPEAFNKVGLNIGNEPIGNAYDTQLFIFDLKDKKVTPITKEFDPSVDDATWNYSDRLIYMKVSEKDCKNIYSYDPKSNKFTKLEMEEEVVKSFSVSQYGSALNYYGQSVSNADRLYFYNVKKKGSTLLYDLSKEKMEGVQLGEVYDWDFTSADGTLITGRFYLPPNFDSTKTYPMLVYYYGGTTPTVRTLEFSYSMHMYAAQGYVVYTLNPSGTIGFGQEFSARHVNAWGKRTADEIILGTQLFYRSHPYVDSTKVGCFGASYGGFMTMYLQTQTDIFAAAISHAGISALTSYWGEGYWGIGYCSIANADSYPWNNPDLFVNQSPLFLADKINTPLLLLHGDKDTNVPVGESIQMYNALRILGKPVAFIQIEGEDHGVVDYHKRIQWAKTMQAWFAKYLKDQPEWWEELYPTLKLK